MIHFCDKCKPHEFQDTLYGPFKRVMNRCGKLQKENNYRCTVCGTKHLIGGSEEDNRKAKKSAKVESK